MPALKKASTGQDSPLRSNLSEILRSQKSVKMAGASSFSRGEPLSARTREAAADDEGGVFGPKAKGRPRGAPGRRMRPDPKCDEGVQDKQATIRHVAQHRSEILSVTRRDETGAEAATSRAKGKEVEKATPSTGRKKSRQSANGRLRREQHQVQCLLIR